MRAFAKKMKIYHLAAACLCIALWPAPAASGDGTTFGLGVEAENVALVLTPGGEAEPEMFKFRSISTTPAFLVVIRATPNLLIEPTIGLFSETRRSEDNTVPTGFGYVDELDERSIRNLNFGLGLLYSTHPGRFVSPFVHAKFSVHLLKYSEESRYARVRDPFGGDDTIVRDTFKFEMSATAIAGSAGMGGAINVSDRLFITLEGRILYARVSDPEREYSNDGPDDEDERETTSWAITTDMLIGMRMLF